MNYLLVLIAMILPRQILSTAYNIVAQQSFKVGLFELYSGSLVYLSNAQFSTSYIYGQSFTQLPTITIGIYGFAGSNNASQSIMLELQSAGLTTLTLKISTARTSYIKISYLGIDTSNTAAVFTKFVYNSTSNNGGIKNNTQTGFTNLTKYVPIMNVIGFILVNTVSNFTLQISVQSDKFVITSWVASGNLSSYSVSILFVNEQVLKQEFSQFHSIYHEVVALNNNLTLSSNDQVNSFIGLRNVIGGDGTKPLLTFDWTLTYNSVGYSLTFQIPSAFVGQYKFIRIFAGIKQCPSSDPYWEDSSLSNCVAQCQNGSPDITGICPSALTIQSTLLIIIIAVGVAVIVLFSFGLLISISAFGIYWWKYIRVKPKLHPNRSHRKKIDPSQKMKILDF